MIKPYLWSLLLWVALICNHAVAGTCGSGIVLKHFVPDYICFDNNGGYRISSQCLNSYNIIDRFLKEPQLVSFKDACQAHDDCYEEKGKQKHVCDAIFYDKLKWACRKDIQNSLKAYKACIDKALLYNDVVRGQADGHTDYDLKILGIDVKRISRSGCVAYVKAQEKAGAKNPSCAPKTTCSCTSDNVTQNNVSDIADSKVVDSESTSSFNNKIDTNSSMIRIDWPAKLEVSCAPKIKTHTPAHTDVVFSILGLDSNKNYSFYSQNISKKNSSRFYRSISQNRKNSPEIMFQNLYAGVHKAEVWFKKSSIKDSKLIATKTFTITRPEPKLTAPSHVAKNTPFTVSLSNAISEDKSLMRITIVPPHYPLDNRLSGIGINGVKNCEQIEHMIKGLPSGTYEVRLIQGAAGSYKLLKKQTIIVGN